MEKVEMSEANEPLKIGGWLILIAVGVIFNPVRTLYFVGTTYPPIFADGIWEMIITPGSEAYSPLLAALIIGEILVNLMFSLLGVYLAYLFFTKKSVFPKWYLGLALASVAFILADTYLVYLALPELEIFDSETTRELIRGLITLCIWCPYLFISQRSKDTFIKGRT